MVSMKLSNQKRMAAEVLKVGESKVIFDPKRTKEIKEAITKADIRLMPWES